MYSIVSMSSVEFLQAGVRDSLTRDTFGGVNVDKRFSPNVKLPTMTRQTVIKYQTLTKRKRYYPTPNSACLVYSIIIGQRVIVTKL